MAIAFHSCTEKFQNKLEHIVTPHCEARTLHILLASCWFVYQPSAKRGQRPLDANGGAELTHQLGFFDPSIDRGYATRMHHSCPSFCLSIQANAGALVLDVTLGKPCDGAQ